MSRTSSLPLRYDERARALARSAYDTFEPLHVVAYFNPSIPAQVKQTGLTHMARYLGGRGAPLGATPGVVVAATFYNFNAEAVVPAWAEATAYGLDRTYALHLQALESALGDALGDLSSDARLAHLTDRLTEIGQGLSYAGRPLAAAWAATDAPEDPALRLWHAFAALREYRGDGHLAALVQAGLSSVEAIVFHEAPHPDPAVRRRTLGGDFAQLSRAWSDEQWSGAGESLRGRALLDAEGAMTQEGVRLYEAIELATDDAAADAWDGVEDAEELIASARPYVKAVIDAGLLPGSRRKS